jgi:hypothetical protein
MNTKSPFDYHDTRLTASEFWRLLYPNILPEAVAELTWNGVVKGLRRNFQANHDSIAYLESLPPTTVDMEERKRILADVAEELGTTEEQAMQEFFGAVRKTRR